MRRSYARWSAQITGQLQRQPLRLRTPPSTVIVDPTEADASSWALQFPMTAAPVDDVFVAESSVAVEMGVHLTGPSPIAKATVDIVTDAFTAKRDAEVATRRQILEDLASPHPAHYTYSGKLVPRPPLAFGVISSQAMKLAEELLEKPSFALVCSAKEDAYFFEINKLFVEIVFVGRANAGKSSLINAVLGQHVAKTSSVPNSTRTVNFYQSPSLREWSTWTSRINPNKLVNLPAAGKQFTLVDVPGFGIEGMSDKWKDNAVRLTDSYLGVRRSVNTVFYCIDADRGLCPADERQLSWIQVVHGLIVVVVTKCDSVSHERLCSVISAIYRLITQKRRDHQRIYPFVLPVSAETGDNVDLLRGMIVEMSGMIPGGQVREMLKRNNAHRHQAAALRERGSSQLSNVPVEKLLLDVEATETSGAADQTSSLSMVRNGIRFHGGSLAASSTGSENDAAAPHHHVVDTAVARLASGRSKSAQSHLTTSPLIFDRGGLLVHPGHGDVRMSRAENQSYRRHDGSSNLKNDFDFIEKRRVNKDFRLTGPSNFRKAALRFDDSARMPYQALPSGLTKRYGTPNEGAHAASCVKGV